MTIEEAIKELERISEDTVQRDCSTCGRPTAGIYSGVCCYCSLCEVVPEIFKDYHERKHFRSQWTWNRKWKNEALDMAISAIRQQDVTDKDVGKNEPLTMDELREMDGEPVYSEKYRRWFLVIFFTDIRQYKLMNYTGCSYTPEECMPLYRHKPEEGMV